VASLIALSVVLFVFKPSPFVSLVVAVALPAALIWLARETQKRVDVFEREFGSLLMRGDADGLMKLWARSVWVRILGPQPIVLSRWAMILALRGRLEAADSMLEEAYMLTPVPRRVSLLGPLARSKYAIGDFASAAILAEQWRARAAMTGTPSLYLAAAMVELPTGRRTRIAELLDEASGRLTDSDRELEAKVRAKLSQLESSSAAGAPLAESA
jgi:hypothetical protein